MHERAALSQLRYEDWTSVDTDSNHNQLLSRMQRRTHIQAS
jgi:hypothetical protein